MNKVTFKKCQMFHKKMWGQLSVAKEGESKWDWLYTNMQEAENKLGIDYINNGCFACVWSIKQNGCVDGHCKCCPIDWGVSYEENDGYMCEWKNSFYLKWIKAQSIEYKRL